MNSGQALSVKPIVPIPLYIISGFLGSGKTTLLNSLLQQKPKSAIVINEFGTTAIDQHLLRSHQITVSMLSGGCLCCQVKGALMPVLKNLRMAWEKDNRVFEQVFIETSGVANPEPVLDIVLREKWLATRYSLQGIMTTVSAIMPKAYLTDYPELQAQVAWADSLLLTHTDLAESWQLDQIGDWLRQIAPATEFRSIVQGRVDAEEVLAISRQHHAVPVANIPAHRFYSVAFQLNEPVPWQTLNDVLVFITEYYRENLLRVKGLVYTLEERRPILVQGAADKIFPPIPLPTRDTDDGLGRLVFISRQPMADLKAILQQQLGVSVL